MNTSDFDLLEPKEKKQREYDQKIRDGKRNKTEWKG
jgi:hypothetical protein